MEAKTNNKILMAARELCYEYWKKHDDMIDYFLLHDFMAIVLDKYEDDWKKVVPRDNATPHELLLRLFDNYDERMWNAIKEQTPFHKLTYKFAKDEDMDKEQNSYYFRIIRGQTVRKPKMNSAKTQYAECNENERHRILCAKEKKNEFSDGLGGVIRKLRKYINIAFVAIIEHAERISSRNHTQLPEISPSLEHRREALAA